jgi:microcystin-dependent protein
MASLNIPNSFSNGTAANATEVNANFSAVKSFVETALVQADGSVKAGTAAIDNGAITQSKLDSGVLNLLSPVGAIIQFGGASAPTGWFICDGTEKSITTYQTLYNVLTATGSVFPYGANTNGSGGVGSTHFRLPNLAGRIPVGFDAGQTEFDVLGETGGDKSVTLTEAQSGLRSHSHGTTESAHTHDIGDFGLTTIQSGTGASTSVWRLQTTPNTFSLSASTGLTVNSVAGASATDAHTNLQPYIVLNYIIKI